MFLGGLENSRFVFELFKKKLEKARKSSKIDISTTAFFIPIVMCSGLAFGDNPIKHAERGRGQLAYWVRDLKLGGGCLYPYSFH